MNIKRIGMYITHNIRNINRKLSYNLNTVNKRQNTGQYKNCIQYISDLHVDTRDKGFIPRFKKLSDDIIVCGDVGNVSHENYALFFQYVSNNYNKVMFVPGNHDFDCGGLMIPEKYYKYTQEIKAICKRYPNVHYLDNDVYHYNDNYIILGSTLWSNPMIEWDRIKDGKYDIETYQNHISNHFLCVEWIKHELHNNRDKKVIIATHFVPSIKLIEEKYLKFGQKRTSWFYTDLEYIFKEYNNIHAWVCGHTHSQIQTSINNIHCGVNAFGHDRDIFDHDRVFVIDLD